MPPTSGTRPMRTSGIPRRAPVDCDSCVAGEREFEAESADEAVQRADDRLLDTLDPVQSDACDSRDEAPKALQVGTAAFAAARAGVVAERSEIDSRREGLTLAVENDRADVGTIDLVERLRERRGASPVECVALLGPVERDIRDLAFDFYS